MPHPSNQLETVPLRISTTKTVVAYLKELVSTGLYGRHHTDAAERLIAHGIQRLLERGALKSISTADASHQVSPKPRNRRKNNVSVQAKKA
jgi:hypothetical protein